MDLFVKVFVVMLQVSNLQVVFFFTYLLLLLFSFSFVSNSLLIEQIIFVVVILYVFFYIFVVRLSDHRHGRANVHQFFAFTEAGRFKPANAHMEYLYDKEKLYNIAQEEIAIRANVASVNVCAFCSQGPSAQKKLRKCSGCNIMLYCSKQCQTKHWKNGHKKTCSKRGSKKNKKEKTTNMMNI